MPIEPKKGQGSMKKVVMSVIAALAVSAAAPAFAADMPVKTKAVAPAAPVPFDIAIGGVVMSDYNFRGISQSNRGFSGGAYFEPQLITSVGTFYTGIAAYGIDWPGSASYGFTSPSAEVDLYGGWRNSWGPLSLDLGLIYYYYPKETFNGFTSDSDFYEIYAKVGYDLGNGLTVGGNVFYTPDLLNYSETFTATGGQKAQATYASATAKWVTPWSVNGIGSFISGEVGHWWIKDTGFVAAGVVDPSYTYYNVGLAFTYKALTLDLRYHGNDMGTTECNAFLVVGPGNASSNWCNDTFIASLKFDTTLLALK
jgi:uncharacterized protein (TIGR02001 family)